MVYGYAGYSSYVPASGTATQDMGLGYEFVTQGTVSTPGGASLYVSSYSYPFAFNDGMISFDRSSTSLSVNAAYIMSAATGATTTNSATSLPTPGGEFQLVSINLLTVSGTSNVSVQAYANGVAVGSPVTKSVGSTTKVLFDFSTNSSFYSIDEIKITGFGTAGIRADDIKSAAVPTINVVATGNPGCGSGSVTLTASGGTPTGGTYSWYNALSTLATAPVLATGTTFKPMVSGSYYAIYTQGTTTITSSNTSVTENPIVSSPIPNAVFSYSFSGNTKDVSGNQNDGIAINSPTFTTDRFGAANSALNFTGTSSQVVETTTANGNPQTFSISAWFKTTSTTGGRIVGISQNQNGGGSFDRHVYMNNAGQVYFGVYNGATNTVNTTASYNDGAWHHVVATLSSAGLYLYVDNNAPIFNAAYTVAETQTNAYWIIGGANLGGWPGTISSNYFTGTIDDVSIYSTALSAATIATSHDLNQIGPNAPVCAGNSLTLYSPTITGATYSWTDPDGVTATGQNPTFASATSGNYTLTVTGGPGGCTSTATVPITATAAPVATFSATYVSSVATTSTIKNTGTNPTGYTYAWAITGGTPATATGSGPITVTWTAAGAGTVALTVTNPTTGCSTTTTQIFNEANYAYSLPLTINVGNTTALSNFPYLVSITDPTLAITSGGCSNKVQYPGGTEHDFDFTDANGVELPYEIESYDQTAGKLLAWVNIPTLAASGNTTINLLFGSVTNPAHNTAFHQATWANDYQAVYHLNDAVSTGSTVTDATGSGNTGVTTNMASADLVTGKIGNAYTFNGSTSSKAITVVPANGSRSVTLTGTFTLSAWVTVAATADQKIITNQGPAGSSSGGYKLGVYNNNIPESESGTAINRGTATVAPVMSVNTSPATWYYVQSVYNGSQLITYENGKPYQTLATTVNPSSLTNMYIGVGEGGTQYYYNGLIDEPRVSNVAKTTDWLLAEYNNQNTPASYITKGSLATNVTNAELIYGGMTFATTNGTTFTINGTATAGTPLYNGRENFSVTGGTFSLSATRSIYGLNVATPGVCNVNGQTLNVGCNIVNTGTINNSSATASTLTFNGSASAQSYTGNTSTSSAQFGNLTINNSSTGTVTLTGGAVDMTGLLTLTQGNLFIDNTNSGALNLKGNASSNLVYAQIAPITSGTISGSINYQVYFTGVRNYRSMAPPVYNNTTTYSSTNGTYSLASLKGTGGFIITGTGGSTNGFDKSSNNGATLRIYNAATNVYTFITSLNTAPTVASGSAFYMYFRGSRTPAGTVTAADPFGSKTNKVDGGGSYAPADAVMYTYTGVPNQGNVASVPAFGLNDTKFYFLANPYAATLDANMVIAAAPIKTSTWIWNPTLGNYAVYNSTNSLLTVNGGARYIVPGQGFFIQAATAATVKSLTITESMKSVANNLNAARMLSASEPTSALNPPIFRLKFAKDSALYDEIAVEFSDSSKATLDYNDATHLEGTNLTLSSLTTDNEYLAIDVRPFTGKKTTMPLYITPAQDTVYTLKLSYKNPAMSYYKVSLQDSLLNTITDITNKAYSFNIASGQQNTYAKRFKLIVEALPAPALFTKFSGQLDNLKKVLLNWNGGTDRASITYQVQKSVDNKTFANIGTPLTGSTNINYQTMDSSPAIGLNYYRLVQTDAFDTNIYSDTITIANNPGLLNGIAKNGFILYPNAVTDVVSIVGDKTYQGTVKLQIYDNLGKLQASQSFTGMNAQVPIQENISNLKMGVYTARIDNDSKEIVVIKFIKK